MKVLFAKRFVLTWMFGMAFGVVSCAAYGQGINTGKIADRVTLRLEVNAFDVLNRAYYGIPYNNVTDTTRQGSALLQQLL